MRKTTPVTIEILLTTHEVCPIRGCLGRWVVVDLPDDFSTTEWLRETVEVPIFEIDKVRDLVQIVRLKDGGIISYHRYDGSDLHPLNDLGGFARKLQQLGIAMGPGKTST